MPSFLKQKVYRNPGLLKLAARAPRCFNPWCGGRYYPLGSFVPCHSNAQRHGKGTGLKAHDLCAFMCSECHDRLDGRAGAWTREQKEAIFAEAFFQTMLWLLEENLLIVNPKGTP